MHRPLLLKKKIYQQFFENENKLIFFVKPFPLQASVERAQKSVLVHVFATNNMLL
jgi:hypothetical protein